MQYSVKIVGAERLIKFLTSKKTIKKPLDDGIARIGYRYEGLAKVATPWITGTLRSSINTQVSPGRVTVGTNIKYASYVEYGHKQQPGRYVAAIGKRLVKGWVQPRHLEGGSRVYGVGMFEYAWGLLREWLGKGKHNIQREIDREF